MSKLFLIPLSLFICVSAQAASVWEVTKNGNKAYIGGTVHVLSSTDYPLPPEYKKAYDASAKVVFETDMAALQTAGFQQKTMNLLTYQDGRTFKDELSQDVVKALEAHLKSRAIPIENLLSFKPSMLSITLSMIELQIAGLTSQGVDQHYANIAASDNKAVAWLESPDAQLQFMAGLGKGEEDALIQYTLDEIDTLEVSINELRDQWRTGDMAAMKASQLDEMQRDFPQIYDDLLVVRNNNWLPQIKKMLVTPEVEFILVGALHLSGDHSVLKMLSDAGYKIKQL